MGLNSQGPDAKPLREVCPIKRLIGSLVVVAVFIAGAQILRSHQNNPLVSPAERQALRDAPNDNNDLHNIHPLDKLHLTGAQGMGGDNPQTGQPGVPVEWISIEGGKFAMGVDDSNGSGWLQNAKPSHKVTIKNFEMSKTLVTVEQYAECVIKGACTEPSRGSVWGVPIKSGCNWGQAERQRHPINCVNWDQANQYAKFKGGQAAQRGRV